MDWYMVWRATLSMEEMFWLTGAEILVVGIGIGLLWSWLERRKK